MLVFPSGPVTSMGESAAVVLGSDPLTAPYRFQCGLGSQPALSWKARMLPAVEENFALGGGGVGASWVYVTSRRSCKCSLGSQRPLSLSAT